jgi:hypothetical protein
MGESAVRLAGWRARIQDMGIDSLMDALIDQPVPAARRLELPIRGGRLAVPLLASDPGGRRTRRTLSAIDTGAPHTLVALDLANELGLVQQGQERLSFGLDGAQRRAWPLFRWSISIDHPEARQLDGLAVGVDGDGVFGAWLGMDALRCFRLTLDGPGDRFALEW